MNIFFHRQEKATLLGFENFAFLSLDSKMADSPSEVWEMINNLKDKSKAAAQTELHTLQVLQCYYIIPVLSRHVDCLKESRVFESIVM